MAKNGHKNIFGLDHSLFFAQKVRKSSTKYQTRPAKYSRAFVGASNRVTPHEGTTIANTPLVYKKLTHTRGFRQSRSRKTEDTHSVEATSALPSVVFGCEDSLTVGIVLREKRASIKRQALTRMTHSETFLQQHLCGRL
jgi:hypothetical protein